jgi:ABC-type Fe3+/spermidine/putrescine transport system ATPase subunit
MNEPHVVISHVSKRFGSVEVIKDLSLEVPKGAFMTFLGPSGCGKTTLLRTIAGFYEVDEGEIRIGAKVINNVPSHLRGAIMVFQDYALFPHMTVQENITYGLRLKNLPREEIRRRLERTVSTLGIGGLERRNPSQISGGQQQRVALARALVMEPEVLLLDEPLSNLDAKLRMNIRAELRQLQQSIGITTIYVTHDQGEALALSDQIAVIDQGRIVQVGSPWEIYYRPRTAFVADFIGTANIIEGRVVEAAGGCVTVESGEAHIRVEQEERSATAPVTGARISLCARPETIRLDAARPADMENVLVGEIRNSIFEGTHTRYWLRVGERTVVVDEGDTIEKGIHTGTVYLTLHPRKLHILRDSR